MAQNDKAKHCFSPSVPKVIILPSFFLCPGSYLTQGIHGGGGGTQPHGGGTQSQVKILKKLFSVFLCKIVVLVCTSM